MVRMVTPNTNISTGSIKTDFLKDNAVTTAKITDYSVTPGKISLPTEVGDKVLTFDNTTGTVDWSPKYTYQDEDVDAHLNTSTATTNQVLVWSGTDYDWRQPDNNFYNGIVVGGGTSTFNDDVVVNGDIDLNGDIDISGSITGLSSVTANGSFTLTATGTDNITLDAGGYVFADTANFYVGSTTQAAHITGTSIGQIGTNLDIYGNFTGDVTGQVSDISNHNTGDLTEGSNLYFTDARAISAVENETTLELSEGLTVDSDILVGDYDLLSTTSYSSTGIQVVKPDTKAKWAAVSVIEYGGDYNSTLPFGSFHNPTFGGEIHGGTQASPTAAPNGKRAVQFNGAARYGTGASDVHTIANIVIATNETQTSTTRGANMQFRVTPNGDSATRDFLKLSGQGSQRIDVDYDPSGQFSQTRFSTQSTDGFEFVGEVKFYDTIELDQKTAHPTNAVQGQMYFNTTDEKFYGYTGTTNGWVALN